MVDWSAVVVALITGGLSALVTIFGILRSSNKTMAVLEVKVDTLDRRINELDEHVKKHNNLVERMVAVEQCTASNARRVDHLEANSRRG